MERGRNRSESASNFCLEYNDGGLFIVSQQFFCLAVALIRLLFQLGFGLGATTAFWPAVSRPRLDFEQITSPTQSPEDSA